MQELRFKIRGTEAANIEIQPCPDGSVDIVVKYGSYENKPSFSHNSVEGIIDSMKEAVNAEYAKAGSDKEEIVKFVKSYENKIMEDGWKGKFDDLFNNWCKKRNKI